MKKTSYLCSVILNDRHSWTFQPITPIDKSGKFFFEIEMISEKKSALRCGLLLLIRFQAYQSLSIDKHQQSFFCKTPKTNKI